MVRRRWISLAHGRCSQRQSAACQAIVSSQLLSGAGPLPCEMGMRVIPDLPYGDAPEVDVVLVPGGSGARREIANPATTNWLRYAAAKCTWLTSVCTGAFLMVGAGLARGRRITTHHDFIHDLRAAGGSDVVEGVRPSVGPTTEANPLRGNAHRARNPNGSFGRRTIHQGQRHCRANRPDTNLQPT